MKITTEDRLMSDMAKAYEVTSRDLKWTTKGLNEAYKLINTQRGRYPIFYLAGLLTGIVGCLIVAQFS